MHAVGNLTSLISTTDTLMPRARFSSISAEGSVEALALASNRRLRLPAPSQRGWAICQRASRNLHVDAERGGRSPEYHRRDLSGTFRADHLLVGMRSVTSALTRTMHPPPGSTGSVPALCAITRAYPDTTSGSYARRRAPTPRPGHPVMATTPPIRKTRHQRFLHSAARRTPASGRSPLSTHGVARPRSASSRRGCAGSPQCSATKPVRCAPPLRTNPIRPLRSSRHDRCATCGWR